MRLEARDYGGGLLNRPHYDTNPKEDNAGGVSFLCEKGWEEKLGVWDRVMTMPAGTKRGAKGVRKRSQHRGLST